MKAYVSDPEDLKLDPSYQETWDDMIINLLAESLDVIQDTDCGVISLGNVFTKQYALYMPDDENSALLHRTAQSLLSAAGHVTEKQLRLEVLGAISSLSGNTNAKIVFNEVLVCAGRDIVTKDICRLRDGRPMQDAFHVGVDNMCILLHDVKQQPLELPLEERISNALVEIDPSITLSTAGESNEGMNSRGAGLLARYMQEMHAPFLGLCGVKLVVIAVFVAFASASIALSTRIV